MDLRSIINTEAVDSSASKQPTPVTPVQAHPSQSFREHSQSRIPQASPGRLPSQDYGAQPGGPHYPSQSPYQNNYYSGRPPPPPPIQAPPQNDLRSPARSFSAQSPYQQTPSSTSSQYPFPQSHHTPQSPANHNQYSQPPHMQQRDSYPQVNSQFANPSHLQHQNSLSQSSPTPQTPPIGIPGAPHPYLQQHPRSASSSTPTSAQSQRQFFVHQHPNDSPVSASHFPPTQLPQHQRQQSTQSQHSQPGTPLGPPIAQRQASGGFAQPSSPYQQRGFPPGPFGQYPQTSPAPPPPPALPRIASTSSAYDSHRTSLSEQQRRSISARERSLSVSPKTRLPSQPLPRTEMTPQSEGTYSNSSSKRKMDEDQEMDAEQGTFVAQDNVKRESDSSLNQVQSRSPQQAPQQPPQTVPKKRVRYTEPPIWAQSVRVKGLPGVANRGALKSNGKQPAEITPIVTTSSPLAKQNGISHAPVAEFESDKARVSKILGPWEESIIGIKPIEQMTKLVADFLYGNVVSRNDFGELSSRGIEVEIEAKLGQLVDKDTNDRIRLPIRSECVLMESRSNFRSTMTEHQHRTLNEFLNAQVKATHPQNPEAQSKKRVEIAYTHRREVDKFYELPQRFYSTLPPAIREKIKPHHGVSVRVSYDQKTNVEIAKIIKVRVADLEILNPGSPLDCRISINLEMRYDGDLQDLVQTAGSPDRIKDRLSYKQSHYQVDLTQILQTVAPGAPRSEKEHELEIELSAAAVREQGLKAANGESNEYMMLVQGMLDNIRVLQKAVPPH